MGQETWPLRLALGLLAALGGLCALHGWAKRWRPQREDPSQKQQALRRRSIDNEEPSHSPQGCAVAQSHNSLEQQRLQVILKFLRRTSDVSNREHALVTLSNCAAFTVNQDLFRSLGGLSVIANCLLDEVTSVKVKAMNALTNLSLNVANQEEMKIWIPQILKVQEAATLSSEMQVAGLPMLTNFSVTTSHHRTMTNSIPHLLSLLVEGTERVKIQALKILVNLSANPELTHDLLCAHVPEGFLLLFDLAISKEVLKQILVFVVNLKKNMNLLQGPVQNEYKVKLLHSVLFGNPTEFSQKIAALVLYQDHEVKQYIARIMV
ncbi:LOW QUALITY PROTEIN: armadillo repeat-containing protein 10 [Narcine bancroftii]|uniref:LOW QUALITY PROTEIN: armadillo repeat-containing protein 10 n=1 Tax=Narcine bancroftii TaxID=1343680 RepID=UPI0038313E41